MKEGLLFIILLIVSTSVFDTISQLVLKSAINSFRFNTRGVFKIIQSVLRLISIPWVWFGFLASTFSLVIWLFVLSRVELNFAFSVDSMHYIFIAMASQIILKEKVGALRWLGTALIVVGIILVSLS
jgi:uncharacterized membrane protein